VKYPQDVVYMPNVVVVIDEHALLTQENSLESLSVLCYCYWYWWFLSSSSSTCAGELLNCFDVYLIDYFIRFSRYVDLEVIDYRSL